MGSLYLRSRARVRNQGQQLGVEEPRSLYVNTIAICKIVLQFN